MVMSPQVSWLFFKAVRAGLAVKRPYLAHSTRCRLLRAFDAVPHVARVTCIRCICVGWFAMSKRQRVEWIHTGRASNAEKQPTGRGPEGCVENGPAAALLVGYVSIEICALYCQSGSDRLADGPF